MKEFFEKLFSAGDFMPHGHCYFWESDILWTHVVSDGLIGISYFVIPLCLIFIARRRIDIQYRWMLVLFGIFIYSCGTTHLMNIITVWNPLYRLEGIIKVITAISSVGTAFALIKITPKALAIPTAKEWLDVNMELKAQEKQLQEKDLAIQQSEQALRESEERYNTLRDIFDSVVIHQDNSIVYANPAAVSLLGAREAKTLIGKSVMDFVHPEFTGVIKERVQAVEEGQKLPMIEQKIIRLDGTETDIESLSVPFTYNNRSATQVIIRDISERKNQERILRESEAKFRGLFESNMIGTLFWEINGKVTNANDALLEMIGYSRSDLHQGRIDWVQMTPEEYKELDQEAYRQIMSTGIHAPYEKAYIRKDGTQVPIQVGGAFIKGYTDRGVSYVIDITERKKQEKELRESEIKFRHLFELDMLGVIFSDANNNITDANDAFLQTIGYSREELNSGVLQWQQLTPPGYELQDQQAIQSLRTTGSVSPYEKEYIRKDGTKVPILIGASLLKDTRSVIAFVLDITEQDKVRKELKQRALELQVLNAELEESQEVLRLSESRFRRMFESDLIGIVFWDKAGNFLEVNNLFLQTIGYTREEWERGEINWIAITPPEYAALDQQKLAEMDEKGMFSSYEKEYFCKDGSRVSILLGVPGWKVSLTEAYHIFWILPT
ncbi:PAS domain S-box protein [Rhodocytophaga rosea]|uniref:histidine kinase n=1 Tax=Rhodocytophaga rosea TaxID=2704465 RepID=A0A6C0GLE9_9BACT|nr:PAS domain-containing protein [Rhodocytophaga rosea]QHT68470.1 PAS domain S-box protein [Rhodocytophaga rosea]